jgi:hypothetical protein
MDITKELINRNLLESAQKLDLFRLGLYIAGIEVTQAIQHYDADGHLTDSNDRGADNSVTLVANKPAWVRVYLGSLIGATGISGTLEVQRRHNGFLWSTVATLNPTPPVPTSVPGLVLGQDYDDTRGVLSTTLNFILPANEMIGTLRLIARASSGARTAERRATVSVTLRQTLRLAGVMISYNGPASNAPNAPNLTLAAPTLADLQAMSGRALTLFPVQSTAQFRTAGTLALTNHLQDTSFPTSGCGAGWDALHARVANARTADGNQPGWIYYGLLPAATPMGPVGGCGGGGVAVGPINQPGTLAHEAGHACGLPHAPAGGAPNADPNYPAYEPYDTPAARRASIGEFGLDINNGNIASPQTFRDFMAYGGPAWISLHHYGRLLQNDRLNPVTVGVDHPWWKDFVWEEMRRWPWFPLPDPPPYDFDLELPVYPPPFKPQDMISLIVRIADGRVAEVLHVARTRLHATLERTAATPFTARLLEGDKVLAEAPLRRLHTAACGCGCGGDGHHEGTPPREYLAQALVADAGPGSALEILADGQVQWTRASTGKPPRVEGLEAKVDRKGQLRVGWTAARGATEYWLRWSRDGEQWQSLATGLTDTEARVDAAQLPAGKILLQVVAHDGFHSAASKPTPLALPARPPQVAILHPQDGHTYQEGQPLRLWGSATSAGDDRPSTPRATWLLGRKAIGEGLDAWTSLPAGEHALTLRVEDAGGSTEATVKVKVSGRDG